MDSKAYWCPKCGRMFLRRYAFVAHVEKNRCAQAGNGKDGCAKTQENKD